MHWKLKAISYEIGGATHRDVIKHIRWSQHGAGMLYGPIIATDITDFWSGFALYSCVTTL
jgi:hypothetical protein